MALRELPDCERGDNSDYERWLYETQRVERKEKQQENPMAKYAVINARSNEWECESEDLASTKTRLADLRQTGVSCVLVQVLVGENEPNVPNIFLCFPPPEKISKRGEGE